MGMQCGMVKRVRSQTGASLPLALMLFLICALLASVVLAASTGASGRHSQLAAMDQRYYSVVSAAGLVQKEFEGQEVVLTCEQEKDVTTTVTYSESGAVSRGNSSENVKGVKVSVNGTTVADGTEATAIDKSKFTLPELSALYLLAGKKSSSIDPLEAWELSSFSTEVQEFEVGTYNLAADVSTAPSDINAAALEAALKVSMTEWALADGSLEFQLYSAASDESDSYAVTLECTADIDIDESSDEVQGNAPASTGGVAITRTETSTVTTTRTITISWAPSSLYKTGSTEEAGA